MDGWIRLWRQISENPMWLEKPFTRGQAWVDLLLLANHQDRKILLGNRPVVIQRGQLHTSELKLAKRWGWGRKKVRAYLSLLEKDKMATTIGTTQGTTITIENYASFQGEGPTKGTTIGTSEEQPRNNGGNTNKNVKNEKNIFVPPTLEQIRGYCIERGNNVNPEKFFDFYTSKGWLVGQTKMKDWKAAVRTWESQDVKPPRTDIKKLNII